ncbi:MAG: glycosyltransferase family 1 protein [Rubrivivax sp.]|nr:glycosyltransferase family 1 protein [Rubrivivax sp.]MCA3256523.1 glycosyltransferase family 1 protein [Rubrivivax sp.]
MRLRVAMVTETYPPEVNGVAATAARVVEGLHAAGHVLQLVRPRPAGAAAQPSERERWQEVWTAGVPIPRYPELRMGLPARSELLRSWRASRPDVVHLVTEGPLGHSALRAALALGLPVVSDFRTNFHAYSGYYGLAWLRQPIVHYLRHFHNRTACTMVPTDSLRGQLALQGFRNLRVVARGVDTSLFDPRRRSHGLRATWGAGPNDLVAVSVGRLAAEKNLGLLLEAHETMRARDPSTRLVIVGDGPMRSELATRAPSAHFAGLQRGEALAAHYASADLLLFPSITETFGNVVPEAMASGLAVVAYDYAAARELLRHGDSGLLVPFDDAAAFRAAAGRLAGQLGWVRAMGNVARLGALGHDWRSVVARVEQVYAEALGFPAAAPVGTAAPGTGAAAAPSSLPAAGTPADPAPRPAVVTMR